jgi:hypothetical protein
VTGFSPRVRLLVRTRAGGGSSSDACCEACGVWLGEHGGQIQHRLCRGRGGSKDPVVASAANALLMCGLTAQDGCHGKAESRDPKYRMEERGFVIRHGNGPGYDPRFVPVILFGDEKVWLSETEPRYLYEAPEGAVAA